jgi:hypothetical protein
MKPRSLEELVDIIADHQAAHSGTRPQSLGESANEALVKVFGMYKDDLITVSVQREIASCLLIVVVAGNGRSRHGKTYMTCMLCVLLLNPVLHQIILGLLSRCMDRL